MTTLRRQQLVKEAKALKACPKGTVYSELTDVELRNKIMVKLRHLVVSEHAVKYLPAGVSVKKATKKELEHALDRRLRHLLVVMGSSLAVTSGALLGGAVLLSRRKKTT